VARNWVVYSKRPFSGPSEVVRYIGRYTHKVAISNSRLISMDNGQVLFQYKDYRDKGRKKEAVLDAEEFIRRFLMHVLPEGFHRIRHFGFLANGRCKAMVEKIRRLFSFKDPEPEYSKHEGYSGVKCPVCKKGILTPVLVVRSFGTVILNTFYLFFGPKEVLDTS